MRKTGKIISFTPYEAVLNAEGQAVMGRDGLAVMKRTVVVDCSYTNEDGYDIRDAYVCDMYKEVKDEDLQRWKDSSEKVAFYITCDINKSDDGRYFQKVKLTNIRALQ